MPEPGAIGEVLARALRDAPARRCRRAPRRARRPRVHEPAPSRGRPSSAGSKSLAELAPLHNPPAIAAILSLQSLWPDLPQVACFDTAFHATMPPEASTYALPDAWRDWGLRRFGFHGLSHAWASRRAAELLGGPAGLAAAGDRPPRLGRVAGGGVGGSVGRHHHGLHAARGPRHGDTLGKRRPGRAAVGPAPRADDRRRARGRPGPPLGAVGPVGGVGRSPRGPGAPPTAVTSARSSPSASTSTGCAPRSPPWSRPWAGSTGWCSPEAPERGRPGCAGRPAPVSGSWASSSTSSATTAGAGPEPTGWSHPTAPHPPCSSSMPERTSRSPARSGGFSRRPR